MKKSLIELYLKHEIFKISFDPPFTWSSGIKSPFYCDHRKILSHIELRDLCLKALINLIEKEFPTTKQIAAVATAGIPWGSIVADRMKLPLCYVRSKPKEHGLSKLIEGEFRTDLSTIIIEDLFSTGKSVIQAAHAIKNEFPDAIINGAAALFSYELRSEFESDPSLKKLSRSVLVANDILSFLEINTQLMVPYQSLFTLKV
ncbi:MAG: phosphoribosyltransferase family protein [Bacteriovoracaceae bacterium]|nr:phosphoribosyltransferase family protein [Bacteriovoracaceae bacterium]